MAVVCRRHHVDLTTGETRREEVRPQDLEDALGGIGLMENVWRTLNYMVRPMIQKHWAMLWHKLCACKEQKKFSHLRI